MQKSEMKRPASQRHLKTAAKRAKSDDDYFEIILKRPGLQHIAESIFSFLNDDVKSMAKCREVSSDFKNLIDRQKTFFIKRIQNCQLAIQAAGLIGIETSLIVSASI